jgi:hypothetical protein
MNCAKAIKKIEKYLGIKVEIDDHGRCWFQYEDKICSFFPNGSSVPSSLTVQPMLLRAILPA